jgi:NAD(P)-dependent dehydrogenase (short-subunit alcohol dehydrogenase family)
MRSAGSQSVPTTPTATLFETANSEDSRAISARAASRSTTDMNPAEGEFAEMLKKLMALPRYAHVDEIAAMVAYLAGPEAGFVTGASLMIDGGFAA